MLETIATIADAELNYQSRLPEERKSAVTSKVLVLQSVKSKKLCEH